jgi:DNA-binding response OmpR family regulator
LITKRTRVLLVEDDPLVGSALERCLRRSCDVMLAQNIADACRLAHERQPDVVITDHDLQDERGRDGVWLLDHLKLPGVILTGHELTDARHPVLQKPAAPATLLAALEALIRAQE